MKPLKAHHVAWLMAHPERTAVWLRERLKDRFDVHHLDGDRENNAWENLVLIESVDHLMLHNGHRKMLRMNVQEKRKARQSKTMRGMKWSEEDAARWRSALRYTAFMP